MYLIRIPSLAEVSRRADILVEKHYTQLELSEFSMNGVSTLIPTPTHEQAQRILDDVITHRNLTHHIAHRAAYADVFDFERAKRATYQYSIAWRIQHALEDAIIAGYYR